MQTSTVLSSPAAMWWVTGVLGGDVGVQEGVCGWQGEAE